MIKRIGFLVGLASVGCGEDKQQAKEVKSFPELKIEDEQQAKVATDASISLTIDISLCQNMEKQSWSVWQKAEAKDISIPKGEWLSEPTALSEGLFQISYIFNKQSRDVSFIAKENHQYQVYLCASSGPDFVQEIKMIEEKSDLLERVKRDGVVYILAGSQGCFSVSNVELLQLEWKDEHYFGTVRIFHYPSLNLDFLLDKEKNGLFGLLSFKVEELKVKERQMSDARMVCKYRKTCSKKETLEAEIERLHQEVDNLLLLSKDVSVFRAQENFETEQDYQLIYEKYIKEFLEIDATLWKSPSKVLTPEAIEQINQFDIKLRKKSDRHCTTHDSYLILSKSLVENVRRGTCDGVSFQDLLEFSPRMSE